jgi:cellulose synthase/poly-beta-1,6-N-acetylglucosamine synthase-like glycosyltransferase
LILQSTTLANGLAAAIAILIVPLAADLAVCIAGNLRRRQRTSAAKVREVRLAVLVPAHNEEAVIARALASLRLAVCVPQTAAPAPDSRLQPWQVPVFVVAHNCTDSTAAIATRSGARVVELKQPGLRGKGAALRAGFNAARAVGANAFLVVDADSQVSRNLIAATAATLEHGAAATQCRYELELPDSRPARARERLRVLAFRAMNVLRARGRAHLGFSAGVFGNGFAVAAETLETVPYTVDSICEDLEYHTRLVAAGLSVAWVDEAKVVGPLAPTRSAQAAQEARWEGGRFHVAAHATGRLLRAILHGNWRAFEMLAEVWSLPIARAVLALVLAACLPVHWLHVFALVTAGMILIHVLQAVLLGSEPWRDFAALAGAPLHFFWKMTITPLVLRQSRADATWARTEREVKAP